MPPKPATREEVLALLDEPGFTPGSRHFAALIELAGAGRETAELAVRVLARGGAAAARALLDELARAGARAPSRLLEALGRIARTNPEPEIAAALLTALSAADPRIRRSAIRALGNLRAPGAEERMIELWSAAPLEERRALAAALGKIGGPRSLALLSEATSDDAELGRLLSKSRLMLSRSVARDDAENALDRELPGGARVVFRCRAGLARLLADEVSALARVEKRSEREVEIRWRGALGPLLSPRTALEIGLVVPLRGEPRAPLETPILQALLAADVQAALSAWTAGTIRFRLAFAAGGHRRAAVWRLAAALAERAPRLVNDPTRAPWEFLVDEAGSRLLLIPRGFDDPRFAYRRRDVSGASHPTIAAALAREAGARDDDVVWDPFVGSGLELVERAKLGPARALHGSDLDAGALAAARENLAAAGVNTTLALADARAHRVAGATLIVTNPPMGRRVARSSGLSELLLAFLANAHAALAPSGRMVWLSPRPAATAEAARTLGFSVQRRENVDLGGFPAELQRLQK